MIELTESKEILNYENNKYFRWYWNICNRAKDRILPDDIYTEKHHVYPKSLFGENKDVVTLTLREHYIIHLVLWRGLRNELGTSDPRTRKMACAFTMMNRKGNTKREPIKYNSKNYTLIRTAYYEARRNKTKEEQPMFGKKHSEETKQKMSLSAKGKQRSPEHCKNLSKSQKGRVAPNKGIKIEKSRHDRWVEKYGVEEAIRRRLEAAEKISKTQKENPKEPWNKGKHNVQDYSKHKKKEYTPEMKEQMSKNNSGKNNPMYGRSSYEVWIEKYGIEEANKRRIEQHKKINETKIRNRKKMVNRIQCSDS